MKKSIQNLGQVLSKNQLKDVKGGNIIVCSDSVANVSIDPVGWRYFITAPNADGVLTTTEVPKSRADLMCSFMNGSFEPAIIGA